MIQPKSRVSIHLKTVIHDGKVTEENEATAVGVFHQKETLAVLTYKEEMEGYGAVNTLITIHSERISIKRTGAVSMHQQFHLHHPTENVYQHPHGNIHMETFTDRISYIPPENEKPGRLELEYNVKLNGQEERKHTLGIVVYKGGRPMSILEQTEAILKQEIGRAAVAAKLATEEELPEIILEKPKDKAHGDFAANIAMQLARIAKKAPRQIAEAIVNELNREEASIEKVDIAGPGFINFFMKNDFLTDIIPQVLKQGADYGKTDAGKGERVQVEFVSVNPTGDLHLGHARGAAYGDVLCNIFDAAGYNVEREYYINDAGSQIDNLGLSVEARYLQELGQEAEMPEDGYRGQAIIDMAKAIVTADGDKWVDEPHETRLSYMKEFGLQASLKNIERDLKDFHVEFDNWFSERTLYEDGQIPEAMQKLEEGNYIYEKDGATWFKSTAFGDDKDRVIVKQDGSYTYLTPDIAYHKNKLDRGFDKLINVWGSDHHGYIARMQAAIQALGYSEGKLDVKIIQMVNLFEGGEKVRMSKRTGKAVSLRDLMEEVGIDATRYFFVARSNDTQLDFDMDLARSQSNENPVYYVQYAHARISTMLEQARSKGINTEADFDDALLTSEKEHDLLKKLGEFPQVIADAAEKHAPQRLTNYVFELAALLHSFYNAEKVLNTDDLERTSARIALMKAVRTTIANGLKLIGVTAPEKM